MNQRNWVIKELPADERPREKLQTHGAASLADADLIAILLRTGCVGTNAMELARALLVKFGSLQSLARADFKEIASIKGIGPTKATQLLAAFGLGHRLAAEPVRNELMDTPEQIYRLLGPELRTAPREVLKVVLLDTKLRLQRVEEVSSGTLNESVAHPRDIFRPAVAWNSYGLILVHNHPSGDPGPSMADRQLTTRLAEGAQMLQIRLIDHIIIGAPGDGRAPWFSFREAGLL